MKPRTSGLLVNDHFAIEHPADHCRLLAYQNYLQGRKQARRLVIYMRLAKYWGSFFNLLAYVPMVSGLTTGFFVAYREYQYQHGKNLKEVFKKWGLFFLISCIPVLNALLNRIIVGNFRDVLQGHLSDYLHTIPERNRDNLDVDDGIQIFKLHLFNTDLNSKNDKVIRLRLTLKEFQAYQTYREMIWEVKQDRPKKKDGEPEKIQDKPKKLFEEVKNWRGALRYHLYLDQEQNERFKLDLRRQKEWKRGVMITSAFFSDRNSKRESKDIASALVVDKYLSKPRSVSEGFKKVTQI